MPAHFAFFWSNPIYNNKPSNINNSCQNNCCIDHCGFNIWEIQAYFSNLYWAKRIWNYFAVGINRKDILILTPQDKLSKTYTKHNLFCFEVLEMLAWKLSNISNQEKDLRTNILFYKYTQKKTWGPIYYSNQVYTTCLGEWFFSWDREATQKKEKKNCINEKVEFCV